VNLETQFGRTECKAVKIRRRVQRKLQKGLKKVEIPVEQQQMDERE
jgi:hypothetical protein